jgi:tetraacyldisaccharide 4'-kinase
MINLNYPLLKPVRILLLPFSLVYGLIVYVRNWMFDWKLLRSASYNLPIVCIGNLAIGGTGKSPMVEFRLKNSASFRMAVLNRGYKRKTRGYALATKQSTALEIEG